jgi:predicted nucleic acid-binding Zn ribbon protein
LGNVVGNVLRDKGWSEELSAGTVMSRWAHIVGEEIAEHTTIESYDNNSLVVRASSTAWATQLLILRSSILRRIDEEVGQGVIQEITVKGPGGPSFTRGRRSVKGGRGPRDTWG